MNSKKYRKSNHKFRKIRDLREMFYSSCKINPDTVAFYVKRKHGEPFESITYKQMRRDLEALGTALLKNGYYGKKIAVIGENSYEWVLVYFATVCGLGVMVPIDRDLQAGEVANLIERSRVSALFYSEKKKKLVDEAMSVMKENPELPLPNVHLMDTVLQEEPQDEIPSLSESETNSSTLADLVRQGKYLLATGDKDYLDLPIDPKELCTILYTSGTMGMAKGVMLGHQQFVANVYNMSKRMDVGEGGIGLSILPMHHSYEMTCHVMTVLYQGRSIAIAESLKTIPENLQEIKPTVILGVPLIFESFLKKIYKNAQSKGRFESLRSAIVLSRKLKLYNKPAVTSRMFSEIHKALGGNVRQMISGGAAINPSVIMDFEAMGIPMMQGYGMTECAPIIAMNRDRYSKPESVGTALSGTEIKIVDPDEFGVGEVICKSPSVMLGYYNDPEETARTIVNGWLHTGDYGYMDKDGYLYLMGRKKNIIITRNGKNVFPEEIEYYLTKNEFILEALVHGAPDSRTGDIVVKADIVPNMPAICERFGESVSGEKLHEIIQTEIDLVNEIMPSYKRVKRFSIRENEFEKTTTHKIKRKQV